MAEIGRIVRRERDMAETVGYTKMYVFVGGGGMIGLCRDTSRIYMTYK